MASRFASISDEEVKEFTEKLENENTKKKTLCDIKVFLYLLSCKCLTLVLPSWSCLLKLHTDFYATTSFASITVRFMISRNNY